MNFTQMHERLRLELLRRIDRGTLSVSLLARQTGFGQSHMSNYLHNRGQLSLEAIDRVLATQHLTVADLLPVLQVPEMAVDLDRAAVPLVSHHAAMFEPFIRPAQGQEFLHLTGDLLEHLHPRASQSRRTWQRFVAVRISATDSPPMDPLVLPDAIVLIDRHYNSLIPYSPNRPNLFAVRSGARLVLRYVDFVARRLVLRPYNIAFPIDLIEVDPDESPADLLTGRIALILNET